MKTHQAERKSGISILLATLVFSPGALLFILIPIAPYPYFAFLALLPLPFHLYFLFSKQRFPLQIISGLAAAAPYIVLVRAILMHDGTTGKIPL